MLPSLLQEGARANEGKTRRKSFPPPAFQSHLASHLPTLCQLESFHLHITDSLATLSKLAHNESHKMITGIKAYFSLHRIKVKYLGADEGALFYAHCNWQLANTFRIFGICSCIFVNLYLCICEFVFVYL